MRLEGRGGPGFIEGGGVIRLHDDGEHTVLEYELDIQVGGRLAGLGQRLLDMTAPYAYQARAQPAHWRYRGARLT